MCTFSYEDIKNGNMTFTFAGKEGNIEFENSKIQYFTDGATDSTVFSINDK